MRLDTKSIELGAQILESHALGSQQLVCKIRVSSKEAQQAVNAWAATRNLEVIPMHPRDKRAEQERRKALIARALRKKRPLPIFTLDLHVYAFRSDAWLEAE